MLYLLTFRGFSIAQLLLYLKLSLSHRRLRVGCRRHGPEWGFKEASE